MSRRQARWNRAVVGVVLAGGALGTIFWWNHSARNGGPKSAVALVPPVGETPSPTQSSASLPSPVLTPLGAAGATGVGGNPTPSAIGSTAVAMSVTSSPSAQNTPSGALTSGQTSPSATLNPPQTSGASFPTTQQSTSNIDALAPGLRPLAGRTATPVPPATITVDSPPALRQGKQLASEGKPLAARKVVNDALLSGELRQPGDIEAAKLLLRELNAVTLFSPTKFDGDPFTDLITIKPGDKLVRIANEYFVTFERILAINGISDERRIRAGQQLKVIRGPFHAVVDKRAFTLDLFLGSPGGPDSLYVTTFRVGLGSNDSTPTGLWRLEKGNKLRNPTYYSPRGEGVMHPGDPKNPLGPYWIGLTGVEGQAVGKLSYGIHGTIDPQSIGKMESMGCIRLVNEDVAQVFTLLYEVKSTVRVIE